MTEETGQAILKEMNSIKLLLRGNANPNQHWVKVTLIKEKTGWSPRQLRSARERGLITFRKNKTGYWYDLSSVPKHYLLDHQQREEVAA